MKGFYLPEDFRFENIMGKDSVECYKQRSSKNKSNLIGV